MPDDELLSEDFTANFTQTQMRRLRREAKARDRPVGYVLRQAVDEYFDQKGRHS